MTKAEINNRVFEKYPKTEKEFTCWQERLRLTNLREAYKKRIEEEEHDKTELPKQDELL